MLFCARSYPKILKVLAYNYFGLSHSQAVCSLGMRLVCFLRQCDSSKSSRKRRSCWEGLLVGPLDGRWLEGERGKREGEGERRERREKKREMEGWEQRARLKRG